MLSRLLQRIAQDLTTRPAAMEPERLREFLSVHAPTLSAPLAYSDDEDEDAPRRPPPFSLVGSVAVIEISGMLIPGHADYYGWVKGYGAIESGVRAAIADPKVSGIVLRVNSPGGYTTGCPECADAIFEARGKKPIVAFAETMAASAGYWVASAADKVYATKAAMVGSIGVWNAHVDYSKRYEAAGIKVTLVHAGARKVDGSPFRPMDDDARENMQNQVNAIWDMFAEATGRNRDLKPAAMKATEARMFMGESAVKEGLADGVRSFEALVAELNVSAAPVPAAPAAISTNPTPASSGQEKKTMSTDAIKDAPALADADRDELAKLRAEKAAAAIAAADRAAKERETTFEKHSKRLTPATMKTMREQLASVDAAAADTILSAIPDQVHPEGTGTSADIPAAGGKKLDPDLELVERAKALQKEKTHLSLGSAVNEVLAKDPQFAATVAQWREANPGPVVNLDAKQKKGA